MGSLKYWVGFSLVPGIGPARFRRLRDHFRDLKLAWEADRDELARAGLDTKTIESLQHTRRNVNLDDEMEKLSRLGVAVLTIEDAQYPERLRHIPGPPPLLYVRGARADADEWTVAVVGTRRASPYGRQATEHIVSELARNGVTVISGLAKGIDAYAHWAALNAGGRTVAVLGNGLDIVYPAENARLTQAVVEQGAVISEYPLGTPPEANNFPPRNRIISGMALGTLVVEAGADSGALITADLALEQGREVFAVPGSIFTRNSAGTHKLIQEGAKLVTCAQDILEELNLTLVPQQLEIRELLPENDTEATLLKLLSQQPLHIDELGRSSGLPMATVSATLTLMQLKGLVRDVGGMNYVTAR